MTEKEQLDSIKQSLHDFIIRTAKGMNANSTAVQVLPETVKAFVDLLNTTRHIK